MLNIPEEIKELFLKDNSSSATRKKFKLTFYDDTVDTLYPYETLYPDETLFPAENGVPWVVIENNRIESESLTITESLSETEDLEFGSCEAAVLEITVADVIEDLTGREFALTVEIGGYEMAMGIYTVESFVRQADRRKRKITAYDRMRWFNVDVSTWYNDLTFPMTLKSFRDSLCDYIGIQQDQKTLLFDSMTISKTIEPSQLSGLDVLKAICQINGCFGHVDKTGQLVYVHLQQTGLYPSEDLFPYEDLFPSEFGGDGQPVETVVKCKNLRYEDYLVDGISGLSIRGEEGDIGANVGTADNVYAVEGNFLVYGKNAVELLNIAQSLLDAISGRTYKPSSLECNAMPWVEVGDAIIAPTRDDVVETFVMKRVTKGCQAMMDTIESTGSKSREEAFGINSQIIQLEGKTATLIKNVEQVSVNITNLKKDTEAQFAVTSEAIKAKVSKGDVSAEISLESGGVSIKGNRLTWEATNSSMSSDGTLKCKNIVATNGNFSGQVTATTGKIGGFTIEDGNLVSSSKNTQISWGSLFIDGESAELGELFVEESIVVGDLASIPYGHGDIVASGDLWLGDAWWKGWSVTETVRELWEYVYGGGWNPCGSDSCGDSGCDDVCDDCPGDTTCEIQECDYDGGSGCSSDCDGCPNICSDTCDGAEGPGCK